MNRKPATALPPWDEGSASEGKYKSGFVVWYQKNADSAGYAYRAKAPYNETKVPPEENTDNWEIDYTYAVPWKSNGKYKIGSRVYYFNGQNSYTYIASARYYGGNEKPNEEVDLDGIRTWELDVDYSTVSTYWYTFAPPHAEFLFPVRKHGGWIGDQSKIASFYPLDPEERPNIYPTYGGDYNGMAALEGYFRDNNIIKEDFSDVNSVYQSYAYDTNAYNFYSEKPDSSGNFTHIKKGIHMAEFKKKIGSISDKFSQNGKKQYVYTVGAYFSYGTYFNPYGFSIEIWPTASDGDYELVPSASLHSRYNTQLPFTYLDVPWPYYLLGLDFYKSGYPSTGVGSIGFNGEFRDPDGNGYDATPNEQCKVDAFFYRNSVAFCERDAKVYLLKTDTVGYYDEIPIYSFDEEGNITGIEDYYYVLKNNEPSVTLTSEVVDSKDGSYNSDTKLSFVRTQESGNQIDFSKYKNAMTVTGIMNCGFKID